MEWGLYVNLAHIQMLTDPFTPMGCSLFRAVTHLSEKYLLYLNGFVFINIAGGIRVTDLAMDLSVIAAVLSSNVDTAIEQGWCMAGEVGLSGEVRPVNRMEQRLAEAEKLGFTDIVIPRYNMQRIDKSKYNINLHPVRKVEEALRILFG